MRNIQRASLIQFSIMTILVGLMLLPHLTGFYHQQVVVFAMIMVILAISLSIVTGLAGQASMGQAALFSIGAYASALLSVRLGVSFWIALPASGLIAALIGLFAGLPSFRARGIYLAFVTLMFTLIVWTIVVNWDDLTGGTLGISGIPRPSLLGLKINSNSIYYYLTLSITVLIALIALRLAHSDLGRAMMAVRDDEYAARMLGFNSNNLKLLAFVISAFFAGIAGSLYAHYVGHISPESFPPSLSLHTLMMISIGGMYRVEGAILGGLLIYIFPEVLRFAKQYWNLIFGALLVYTVIKFPGGIISLLADFRGSNRPIKRAIRHLDQSRDQVSRGSALSQSDIHFGFDSEGRHSTPLHPFMQPSQNDTGLLALQPATTTISSAAVNKRQIHTEQQNDLLCVSGLTHSFGGIRALDDLSLRLPAGDIYGVIGPNGAGKSLLLNIITGFQLPDSGRVIFRGESITGKSPWHIASLGVARTFQEPRVFGWLTVLENVLLAGQQKTLLPNVLAYFSREGVRISVGERERAEALLEEVGLHTVMHERGNQLSYGQKKLLALANALRGESLFILLDEPASGVNPALMDHIMEIIATYCRQHSRTFLVIEHQLKVISGLCSSVFVITQGKLLTKGSPQEVQLDTRVINAYLGA